MKTPQILTLCLLLIACGGNRQVIPERPDQPRTLPLLTIDTSGGAPVISKDAYITAQVSIANNAYVDPFGRITQNLATTSTKIKGRGHLTWTFPKKPFRLKLDAAADIFGMGPEKNWVLLANYIDPTALRNSIAFELGRRLNLPYTHQTQHVNLVLNGAPQGLYLLTEQTEVAPNRVVTDPDTGFLVEFDVYNDEEIFPTKVLRLPMKFKTPDVAALTGQARSNAIARVTGVFNAFEDEITAPGGPGNYAAHIDVDSFVDWFLAHEITHNYEPMHPKSCYFHRGPDGRIVAGPLWDFDWAYNYEAPATDVLFLKSKMWFSYLFKDPAFVAKLKARWSAIRGLHVETLPAYIDRLEESVRASVVEDKRRWPMDNPYRFEADAATLRTWLIQRTAALDAAIKAL